MDENNLYVLCCHLGWMGSRRVRETIYRKMAVKHMGDYAQGFTLKLL